MNHLVLVGDSIFDNGVYVPLGPPVIEQLQSTLPDGWRATLLAVDGDVTSDVAGQLKSLPKDTTHLAVSVGGNDALGYSGILTEPAKNASEVFMRMADIQQRFETDYQRMMQAVLDHARPTIVCTIYDAVPFPQEEMRQLARTALPIFNDVILRIAIRCGLPVLDLREICTEPRDYSEISPIEPSEAGGQKIADGLARILTSHDFSRAMAVYGGCKP